MKTLMYNKESYNSYTLFYTKKPTLCEFITHKTAGCLYFIDY